MKIFFIYFLRDIQARLEQLRTLVHQVGFESQNSYAGSVLLKHVHM